MSDPYVVLIQEQWDSITRMYNQFAEEHPIMVVDVKEGEILAYPYDRFLTLLDRRSQMDLEQQYQRAVLNHHMVLFVRDVDQNAFLSYSLQLEDDDGSTSSWRKIS